MFIGLCGQGCTPKLTKQDKLVVFDDKKGITRKEQLKIYDNLKTASEKKYTGYSQAKVLDACEDVLNSIANDDSEFIHFKDRIIMKKRKVFTMLFLTNVTHEYWILTANRLNDNEVSVQLRMKSMTKEWGALDLLFASPGDLSPEKAEQFDLSIQQSDLLGIEYEIFFKRLDYILGEIDTWYDCEMAKSYVETKEVNSGVRNPLQHICGKYF